MNLVTAYSLRWKDGHGPLSSGVHPQLLRAASCRGHHFLRGSACHCILATRQEGPCSSTGTYLESGVGKQGQRTFAFSSTQCDMKKNFLLPKTCIFLIN